MPLSPGAVKQATNDLFQKMNTIITVIVIAFRAGHFYFNVGSVLNICCCPLCRKWKCTLSVVLGFAQRNRI